VSTDSPSGDPASVDAVRGDPIGGDAARGARGAHALRIGLTGPIGCGKSTVAGWLADLGARVIDADMVAREVTRPGSPELAAVVASFGAGVLRSDGSLDRSALGRLVFSDATALIRLEAIIHPAVRPRILAEIADADRSVAPAVVVEAIKLVEGGLADLCDEVWLITCDPADQLARLAARGSSRADSEARIAAQSDLVARLTPRATRILDTSGPRPEARLRVLEAWAAAIAPRPGDSKPGTDTNPYPDARS
jgi:dephospho-CoA kinase